MNNKPRFEGTLTYNTSSTNDIKINAAGIQFQPYTSITIDTKDHNIDATRYCVNDIATTKWFDNYVKGIWNMKEEEKDMRNELLEMYIKNAKKDIDNRRKEEIDNHKVQNLFIERYCDLVENFESELEELYLSQKLVSSLDLAIEGNSMKDNVYKYQINKNIIDSELTEINKKYNDEINALSEMEKEVYGHLSMIKTCEEDSYDKYLSVLITYGILNNEGKLNKYKKPSCECKKAGRKPKKEQV